ncbi:MAG: hemolysin III family protein, partial [Clostridiales bacterium]|nr:hemolysin III family protein [Clostridiales bacterium]
MIKNRISLKDKIKIPHYSLSEELVNAVSHGIGALFSVAALVLTVVFSVWKGNVWGVVSSAIYGGTLIILYTMSTLYHSFKVNNAKRVFRIIDHCSIYLLIAGTYTPYTLVSLRGPVGWTLFGVVWGAAILGIIFNSIDMNKYKIISMIAYIAMGWVIVLAAKPLYES